VSVLLCEVDFYSMRVFILVLQIVFSPAPHRTR
jgi:hypothetical protein